MNVVEIIKKYYLSNEEALRILLIHSQQVAHKAFAVAEAHPELDVDKNFIFEAAMLHDIGIVACNAPRIGCFGTHEYIEHGYLGAMMLRAEKLDRHALVAERHTGVGISKEQIRKNLLPIPLADYRPISLEEKIVCYADKFYSKTHLDKELEIAYIRKKLEKFGEDTVLCFNEWHKIFGIRK